MPRNSSGVYSAPINSWNPASPDTTISSDDWNNTQNDYADALTTSIASDGTTTTTAPIPFAEGIIGDLTGNADTATSVGQLTTGRTIGITGDLTYTSPAFNGSANVTAAATLAMVNGSPGVYGDSSHIPVIQVNGKGLVTAASQIAIGTAALQNIGTSGANVPLLSTANTWTTTQTFNGAVTTPQTAPAVNEVGYLGAPQNIQNANYGLVLTDCGKHLYHTTGTNTWTIPANASVAFPVGTVIALVVENGSGNLTLAITSDTLRWQSSTGSRTIAANGTASLLKVAATVWRLTGDQIS